MSHFYLSPISTAQKLKMLFSKAVSLSWYGPIQDSLYKSYYGAGARGFGNLIMYNSLPPDEKGDPVKNFEVLPYDRSRVKRVYLQFRHDCPNPSFLAYMQDPNPNTGEKYIDLDLNFLGAEDNPPLCQMDPILSALKTVKKLNSENKTLEVLPGSKRVSFIPKLWNDIRSLSNSIGDDYASEEINFTGAGFQIRGKDWETVKQWADDDLIGPENKNKHQFQRFFSPQLLKIHLFNIVAMDVWGAYPIFIYSNPSFFEISMRTDTIRPRVGGKMKIPNLGKFLSRFEFSFKNYDLISMIGPKNREDLREIPVYVLRRYIQTKTLKHLGLDPLRAGWLDREFNIIEEALK